MKIWNECNWHGLNGGFVNPTQYPEITINTPFCAPTILDNPKYVGKDFLLSKVDRTGKRNSRKQSEHERKPKEKVSKRREGEKRKRVRGEDRRGGTDRASVRKDACLRVHMCLCGGVYMGGWVSERTHKPQCARMDDQIHLHEAGDLPILLRS